MYISSVRVLAAAVAAGLMVSLASPVVAQPRRARVTLAQLTTGGSDTSPLYSPNGARIAFIGYGDSVTGDVFVIGADGSGRTKLTTAAHSWIWSDSLAWSPTGRQIAFVAQDVGNDYPDIFVVDADGARDPVNVTGTPGVFDFDPEWSPDGAKIVYSRDGAITVMAGDGGGATALTADPSFYDVAPAWSPDGQAVAFARRDGLNQNGHICVVPADGGDIAPVTTEMEFVDDAPRWSPDGRTLAFVRGIIGSPASIFVIGRDGGTPVKISGAIAAASLATWSPNGKRVAFAGANAFSPFTDIYVVNADGSVLTNLTSSPAAYDYGPASWARNGASVLFWSSVAGWPQGDLYTVAVR